MANIAPTFSNHSQSFFDAIVYNCFTFLAGFKSRGNNLGDLPRVTRERKRGRRKNSARGLLRDCADCECIAAVVELGAKGSASRALTTDAFYRFSHGPYSLAARSVSIASRNGGRRPKSFRQRKTLRERRRTVRSIGRDWTCGTISGSSAKLFIDRLSMDNRDIIGTVGLLERKKIQVFANFYFRP